jgi:peptide/nickel transport system substrate-binding protein
LRLAAYARSAAASLAGRGVLLSLCGLALGSCAPSRERVTTVVYASGADLESANPITTLHPLARQIQRYALFVTLARYDEKLDAQPYFARAWQWSADRRALTFSLYRGLLWHDGSPTTAADVAFTLDAARDPASASPRAAEMRAIESVQVENDTSLTIHFRTPPPAFPGLFCELAIAPAHLLSRVARPDLRRAAFNLDPVGNGPFRFVSREAGRRWIFERNRSFPEALGGPPRIARIVVAIVDEPTTKFAGLVSGDLDVAGIAPTMANLVAHDRALRILAYPVAFSNVLAFNTTRAPFDDSRVRRALSAAIDRRRIVNVALAGFAMPAAGPTMPDHPLARDAKLPPESAVDSLLSDAGWKREGTGWRTRGGKRLAFELLTVGSGDNAAEQLIQADFRAIGVDMAIRQMELGAFLSAARAPVKTFDALITGISGDLALSHVAGMFDSPWKGGALDYAGYHTPRLDSLFARVNAASSPAELRAAWAGVQDELAVQQPVAWLYHSRGVQGLARRLQHVAMDLRGELPTLTQWELAPASSSHP